MERMRGERGGKKKKKGPHVQPRVCLCVCVWMCVPVCVCFGGWGGVGCVLLQCETGCIWWCVESIASSRVLGYRQPSLWSRHRASPLGFGLPAARRRVTSPASHSLPVTSGQFSVSAEPKTETVALKANLLRAIRRDVETMPPRRQAKRGDADAAREGFFPGAR